MLSRCCLLCTPGMLWAFFDPRVCQILPGEEHGSSRFNAAVYSCSLLLYGGDATLVFSVTSGFLYVTTLAHKWIETVVLHRCRRAAAAKAARASGLHQPSCCLKSCIHRNLVLCCGILIRFTGWQHRLQINSSSSLWSKWRGGEL